jgi:DNA-binding IclR family transcriptional regulator
LTPEPTVNVGVDEKELLGVLAILDALAADEQRSSEELADQVGLPPASAAEILRGLEEWGGVEQTGPGTWRLGPELLRLGRLAWSAAFDADAARA